MKFSIENFKIFLCSSHDTMKLKKLLRTQSEFILLKDII